MATSISDGVLKILKSAVGVFMLNEQSDEDQFLSHTRLLVVASKI